MPPLPLDPEDRLPPLNRATKRVTMDFSLLSVPLPDLLQLDCDSDNDKQAAGQRVDGSHEENIPIQVFCLTFVTSQPDFWLQLYRVQNREVYIFKDSVNQILFVFIDLYNPSKNPLKVPPNVLLLCVPH